MNPKEFYDTILNERLAPPRGSFLSLDEMLELESEVDMWTREKFTSNQGEKSIETYQGLLPKNYQINVDEVNDGQLYAVRTSNPPLQVGLSIYSPDNKEIQPWPDLFAIGSEDFYERLEGDERIKELFKRVEEAYQDRVERKREELNRINKPVTDQKVRNILMYDLGEFIG